MGDPRSPTREYAGRVNLQAPELLIILAVVLLLFGGAKLPKLARSLGQAQKEFKDGIKGDDAPAESPPPAAPPPQAAAPPSEAEPPTDPV
jgi:sec-independent protein translocase protein TatA